MRKLILTVFVSSAIISIRSIDLIAQDHRNGDPYMMDQVMQRMSEELNDVPVNIRRVAVYKVNYNSFRFNSQEVDYIRGEVELALRQYAGLTVLSPPELEPNDKMKIMGNDSTLQILNIQGRSLADVSPEFLADITGKYGVQGLVELSLQRRFPEGLVVSIRMINPESREIVWAKNFISNPYIEEIERDEGKTSVISFGAASREGNQIFIPGDTTAGIADSTLNITEVVIDFNLSYSFRQPLNADNSAYMGFTAGFNFLRSREYEEFDMRFFHFGITYYQALSRKIEAIEDYRVMFFLDANIQVPIGDESGEIFVTKPGVIFNLGKNLGFSIYGLAMVSGNTITLQNETQVTFNKIGYGLDGIIRF